MVDVIAIFIFWLNVGAILHYLAAFLLQYLATILLADVLAMWQILSPLNIVLVESDGRCYSHVADEKATYLVCHVMLLPSDRWNGHCRVKASLRKPCCKEMKA